MRRAAAAQVPAVKTVTANFSEDGFDALFQRFRKEILNKVTRNDLTSNNDILKSIFNKLTDVISASRTEYKAASMEKGLNLVEFKMGVRIVFQNVVPAFKLEECSALFVYFDTNRDGRIGADEFIIGIKGKLNFYRSALVDFVFQLLDKNCDGAICEKDMMSYLSKAGTPGILQGKMLTPKKKARQLIMKIGNSDKEGTITLKDLQNFYIDRGLFTVDDVMFKYDMLDDWLLSDELATEYLRSVAPNFEATGATPLSSTSEAMSVLEQQKMQLMQQMEIMRQLQMAAQGGGNSNGAAPAPMDPEIEPSPEQTVPPPVHAQSSRNLSGEQVKELLDTVKLLTKQLEDQNFVLKQKEAQMADMAQNMQDQSDIIRSQQQMISTQQAVITSLTSNMVIT